MKNNKLIYIALTILVVVVFAGLLFKNKHKVNAQINSLLSQSEQAPDIVASEVNLHGKDFELKVIATDELYYVDLSFNNDSVKNKTLELLDGKSVPLETVSYPLNTKFSLVKLSPEAPRESLVAEGSSLSPDGSGFLDDYTIYGVEEAGLREALSLITKREDDNHPDLNFNAEVLLASDEKKAPVVHYKYSSQQDNGELTLIWDGRHFSDSTGKLKALEDKYRPAF